MWFAHLLLTIRCWFVGDGGPYPPFVSHPQRLPGPQNPVQWPPGKTLASETLCPLCCVKSIARAALWWLCTQQHVCRPWLCLAVSLWGLGHQMAWSVPRLDGKAVVANPRACPVPAHYTRCVFGLSQYSQFISQMRKLRHKVPT